jgi:hypothetical protein
MVEQEAAVARQRFRKHGCAVTNQHVSIEELGRVNCCWSSPAQSFLVPIPKGLITITIVTAVAIAADFETYL